MAATVGLCERQGAGIWRQGGLIAESELLGLMACAWRVGTLLTESLFLKEFSVCDVHIT